MNERVEPPVIVVGSGKGGVGKSVVSVLLAAAYADRGDRVLLLDGSQNLGHLQILLGVTIHARLEQLLRGDAEPAELLHRVSECLWFVPGDSGAESLYALPAVDQARLHHRVAALYSDFDVVVVDAGPGLEAAVRLAMMGGTSLVVVTLPEVAALTDAYALIKLVHNQLPNLPIELLVNRTSAPDEAAATHERLAVATERFLGRGLGSLGGLPETPALRDAMRRPGGLLLEPALAPFREQVAFLATNRLLRPGVEPAAATAAESSP
jgi:flagellar biosynthesis protein FlhG